MNVLYKAFQKCKKGVYWKDSVQKYESSLLENLYKLYKSLEDGTYQQSPFYEFDICERGKQRHIKALKIKDRVLQRALCDEILIPLLTSQLIYDNGANIKGKGVDFAKKRLEEHLRKYYINHGSNEGYILQLDISKYFDSIPHDKVYEVLTERITDERLKNLIKHIISTFGEDTGIGIGSQISQVIGIYYLHKFDNYIKIVKGMKYYARYTDDMYIIHEDKEVLQSLLTDIKEQLSFYGFTLNEKKTQIRKLNKRFVFLKSRYILTDSGKVIIMQNKSAFSRERRKLKSFKKNNVNQQEITTQYKSWRGTVVPTVHIKYRSYKSIKGMDLLFQQIISEADNGEKETRINRRDKAKLRSRTKSFNYGTSNWRRIW